MVKGIADQCESSPKWQLYQASGDTVATNFTKVSRAVYVKTAGDVAFVDEDGTAVIWPSIPAGTIVPVRAIRINQTGTTNQGAGEFVVLT